MQLTATPTNHLGFPPLPPANLQVVPQDYLNV